MSTPTLSQDAARLREILKLVPAHFSYEIKEGEDIAERIERAAQSAVSEDIGGWSPDLARTFCPELVKPAPSQDLHAKLAEAEKERDEARNGLMVSEQFRRAYSDGKYKLYSMGGEICEAAEKHLPCSEGPLERYVRKIEREHSPLLVEHNKKLVEMLDAAQCEAKKLRESLAWALDSITDIERFSSERYHSARAALQPKEQVK